MYAPNRYKQHEASTATPATLLVMLFDGAVRFTRQAAEILDAGDAPGATAKAVRAVDILEALQATLRPEHAPALAETLGQTYALWSAEIVRAAAHRDAGRLRQLADAIQTLRDGWDQAGHSARRAGGAA